MSKPISNSLSRFCSILVSISFVLTIARPSEAIARTLDPCSQAPALKQKAADATDGIIASENLYFAAQNYEACSLVRDDGVEDTCDLWMEAADAYVSSFVKKHVALKAVGLAATVYQDEAELYLRALHLYDLVSTRSTVGNECEGARVESAQRSSETLRDNLRHIDWKDIRFH